MSETDLHPLLPVAIAHGVGGMICEALQRGGKNFAGWEQLFAEQELAAKIKLQAAVELSAALREQKIPAVFAKGTALTLSVYRRLGLRPFNDLDLLLSPKNLQAADELLRNLGFALRPESLGNPTEADYVREKLPGFRVCVDLHWGFTGHDGFQAPVRMAEDEIIQRAMLESGVLVPTLEDSLLFSAANLARKCAEPLMLVVDFARMSALGPQWDAVISRATRWRLRTPTWLGLLLAERLCAAQVPAGVLSQLAPGGCRERWFRERLQLDELWRSDRHKEWRYRFLFKLMCLDSAGDMCRVGLSLPKGALRKLGLIRSLAANLPRDAKP
ncbi:MAG TPA: nucleotidyltransferase family protein [Planctomycetota bacterium]